MTDLNKVCFLNSNDGSSILAFGEGVSLRLETDNNLETINSFINEHAGHYLFTCLSYDLKNEIESLTSENHDDVGFPMAIIWKPDLVFKINENHNNCLQGQPTDDDLEFLESFLNNHSLKGGLKENFHFQARTPKSSYLNSVNKLKNHIQRGDIYEVNYCQEYISYNTDLKDINNIYFNLNKITKTPFSSFFQFDEFTIFCCSPERFLRKKQT
jgi:para-aminobenzoate synthetase component 1